MAGSLPPLRLAGHGDEADRDHGAPLQLGGGPLHHHQVLDALADRRHQPAADGQLVEQRLRDLGQ